MTHNNSVNPYGGLGMPGAGFASRGKGSAIKRLNLASAPKVSSISEHPDAVPAAPRTSRSHLLAGLRTAPKTPSLPSSAPYTKSAPMNFGAPQYQKNGYNAPHTAIGSSFSSLGQQYHSINPGQQFYSLPEQVLAPPPLEIDENDEQMDPAVIAQLYATELYLAQRQQQLQQQLAQFHTAQQLAAMGINPHAKRGQHSYPHTPVTPHNMFNGNAAAHIFTQEIAGQPGVYVVYNAVTGQSSLAFDPAAQQVELANSPPPPTPARINTSFGSNTSSPFGTGSPIGSRSRSPPKKSASPPIDVQPLPPPSANAFRRGHNRNRSSLVLNPTGAASDGPRSSRPLATPLTGTFGPGQGRAGEHPVRQPAGPPPFEELQAKPTSKHEGSKNFATRQRRRALNTLVRAGLERRVGSAGGSPVAESSSGSGSAGSTTPVSDADLTFSVPSDNDSDSGLSGQASLPSLNVSGLVKEAPLQAV
jgi:hypothetical protein